jgi:hypothetical protein
LEHILRACPELESPRRRNCVQVSPPLSAMSMDQVEMARYFRKSSIGISRDRLLPHINNNNGKNDDDDDDDGNDDLFRPMFLKKRH